MTLEENKKTIQTAAESRSQSTFPQHPAELESTTKEIFQFYQQIKDLDPHQPNLEESFRKFVEFLRAQEEHMDGNGDAQSEVYARIKFLINSSQYLLGEKIDKLTRDITAIGCRLDQIAVRVDQITNNVNLLTSNITAINTRVDWIEDRLDRISENHELHCQQHFQINERLDRMSERAEAHDQQITRIDERLDRIGVYVQAHTQYITQIDKRLDRMSEHAERHDKQLTQILEHIEVHSRQLSITDERFT